MANMRKIVSPTSSETSETQSVDDNNLSGSGNLTPPIASVNNRNSKNWKRMKDAANDKDADNKRPPWRAVSVSTLPKPDKNSLLRAKLLDASRRLRSGKSSVAIQTDMEPTKLMKEIALSTQTDLILYKDVGVTTDGSYAKRKQVMDEFILTYSVSQMTDAVMAQEVATQTLLPKVNGDDFLAAYFDTNFTDNGNLNFTNIEQELLQQVRKMRDFKNQHQLPDTATTSANAVSLAKKSSLLTPTLASWHFEYDNDINNDFQSYTMDTKGRDRLVLPFPIAFAGNANYYNLKLFFLAIDELIKEANALVNFIENMQLRAETRDNELLNSLQATKEFQPKPIVLPSQYWNNVIERQQQELKDILKTN